MFTNKLICQKLRGPATNVCIILFAVICTGSNAFIEGSGAFYGKAQKKMGNKKWSNFQKNDRLSSTTIDPNLFLFPPYQTLQRLLSSYIIQSSYLALFAGISIVGAFNFSGLFFLNILKRPYIYLRILGHMEKLPPKMHSTLNNIQLYGLKVLLYTTTAVKYAAKEEICGKLNQTEVQCMPLIRISLICQILFNANISKIPIPSLV